jgi:Zn-dependent protease with chaperone function
MRKYHEQRDEARGLTTELCLMLAIAVLGTIAVSAVAMAAIATGAAYGYLSAVTNIVMPADYWRNVFYDRLIQCGVLTLLAVGGTAAYKTWQLADGGGRCVAQSLGGTRVSDPGHDAGRLRMLNVVEELALATGIRPPPVFILTGEPGINAFAAGFNPKEAVIGVTQGAIDRLKRHQLQGIIAHEFSHIINGDMRLNIQILGVLTGVQAITFAARFLLRLAMPSKEKGMAGKHPLGMVLALLFGGALWPIGQIGSLFATLIHLAVNRQREFLADASAVQFTRDPIGLCEALAILQDDESGSRLHDSGARLASHMFFAPSGGAWQRLLQSHPPIEERIRRLDPNIASQSDWLPSTRPAPAELVLAEKLKGPLPTAPAACQPMNIR